MAHHKSTKKRIITNEKARLRNRDAKAAVRTALKKVAAKIEEGPLAVSDDAVKAAARRIAVEAQKGRYHKRTAARMISRLMKAANRSTS